MQNEGSIFRTRGFTLSNRLYMRNAIFANICTYNNAKPERQKKNSESICSSSLNAHIKNPVNATSGLTKTIHMLCIWVSLLRADCLLLTSCDKHHRETPDHSLAPARIHRPPCPGDASATACATSIRAVAPSSTMPRWAPALPHFISSSCWLNSPRDTPNGGCTQEFRILELQPPQ